MATFTSASASKFLKNLDEQKSELLANEREVATYTVGTDEEAVIPEYGYAEVRKSIAEIDEKTLTIRHALHVFNTATVLPEHQITIDEALVRLAQLSSEKRRVQQLALHQPRERASSMYRNAVEYRYVNYDIETAKADYQALLKKISALQLELDLVNQTITFEIDIEA